MIERLLDDARRRARGADAIWRRVESTSVSFDWGRLKAAGATEEAGIGLRVLRDGRVGTAGTTAVAAAGELVDRASRRPISAGRSSSRCPGPPRFLPSPRTSIGPPAPRSTT